MTTAKRATFRFFSQHFELVVFSVYSLGLNKHWIWSALVAQGAAILVIAADYDSESSFELALFATIAFSLIIISASAVSRYLKSIDYSWAVWSRRDSLGSARDLRLLIEENN